jgi:hypothetical protein
MQFPSFIKRIFDPGLNRTMMYLMVENAGFYIVGLEQQVNPCLELLLFPVFLLARPESEQRKPSLKGRVIFPVNACIGESL